MRRTRSSALFCPAQTQEDSQAQAVVAVPDARESERIFGIALARRGLQPIYLRITNRSAMPLRLQLVSIDPNYYTPLEAAGICHFSILRRLSAFGLLAWVFLPLLVLLPIKLVTAFRANRRMDECFRSLALSLHPIPPGETAEGFLFAPLESGTRAIHVCLHATGGSLGGATRTADEAIDLAVSRLEADSRVTQAMVEYTFSIAVPGIAADYLRRDFETLVPRASLVACDVRLLIERLAGMPDATTNAKETRHGDPLNLVVIGQFETLLGAFVARWDESETITLGTCWKTFRAFLMGSEYRYSPVSPLFLFGRSQDVALQRSRQSINERLHLRLWLTPLCFHDKPVWLGQVSRDIGVRFTTKTWNLTTHRVDPDVDEARDYVIEDLLKAERIEAAGYVDAGPACDRANPRRNLTGDPYFTDGQRAVILLSETRTTPRFVAWRLAVGAGRMWGAVRTACAPRGGDDKARNTDAIAMTGRPRIVGIGEILWDVFPDGARFGGAPANFACHVAALGGGASIVSCVGQDPLGQQAISALAEHKVLTDYVARLPDWPTGTVTVEIDDQGQPAYRFGLNDAWDHLAWSAELAELARQTEAVCFGTLGQRCRESCASIRQFLAATPPACWRVCDINLRPPFYDDDVIRESVAAANVLKLNADELPIVAALCDVPGRDVDALARLARRFSLRAVALTRGAQGAVLLRGDEVSHARARRSPSATRSERATHLQQP